MSLCFALIILHKNVLVVARNDKNPDKLRKKCLIKNNTV